MALGPQKKRSKVQQQQGPFLFCEHTTYTQYYKQLMLSKAFFFPKGTKKVFEFRDYFVYVQLFTPSWSFFPLPLFFPPWPFISKRRNTDQKLSHVINFPSRAAGGGTSSGVRGNEGRFGNAGGSVLRRRLLYAVVLQANVKDHFFPLDLTWPV